MVFPAVTQARAQRLFGGLNGNPRTKTTLVCGCTSLSMQDALFFVCMAFLEFERIFRPVTTLARWPPKSQGLPASPQYRFTSIVHFETSFSSRPQRPVPPFRLWRYIRPTVFPTPRLIHSIHRVFHSAPRS